MSSYKGMPVCDLRNVTLEEAKHIEKISGVGALILPKNPSPELSEILSDVEIKGIGATVRMDEDDVFSSTNGVGYLTAANFVENHMYMSIVNGVLIVDVDEDKEYKGTAVAVVNGIVINKKALKGHLPLQLQLNGTCEYLDFSHVKNFSEDLSVDARFISYLKPNTLLVAEGELEFRDDVTVDMLKEKNVLFVITDDLTCNADIKAYLKATSVFDS